MSARLASVRGQRHTTTVSASQGGVELGLWDDLTTGFGDSYDPVAARALAALIAAAADEVERMRKSR